MVYLSYHTKTPKAKGELLVNIISQEARKRQAAVKLELRNAKSLQVKIRGESVERKAVVQTVRR